MINEIIKEEVEYEFLTHLTPLFQFSDYEEENSPITGVYYTDTFCVIQFKEKKWHTEYVYYRDELKAIGKEYIYLTIGKLREAKDGLYRLLKQQRPPRHLLGGSMGNSNPWKRHGWDIHRNIQAIKKGISQLEKDKEHEYKENMKKEILYSAYKLQQYFTDDAFEKDNKELTNKFENIIEYNEEVISNIIEEGYNFVQAA